MAIQVNEVQAKEHSEYLSANSTKGTLGKLIRREKILRNSIQVMAI